MKYSKTEFVANMESVDKDTIINELIDMGYCLAEIEKAMGGRICDLEDTIYIGRFLDTPVVSETVYTVQTMHGANGDYYAVNTWQDGECLCSESYDIKGEAESIAEAYRARFSELSRLFKDGRGYIWTAEEIEFHYGELKADGDTEADTFADYLKNCTDKDGTLTEVKRNIVI